MIKENLGPLNAIWLYFKTLSMILDLLNKVTMASVLTAILHTT